MNRFLLRVLLPFLILISSLFWCGEFYLRSLPNDFKTKNQYLEDNAKDIKLMVLGASTVSMGIKPGYFDIQPAYNFAYASQNLEYNYWIMSKCFDRMDSLKYVILDMSCGMPWNYGPDVALGRNKFYRIYYGYPDLPVEFEMSASIKELYHRIWPTDGKEAIQTIDEDGYQGGYYEDVPYDEIKWKESVKWSVEYYAEILQGPDAGQRYHGGVEHICKIVSKCKEKDIQVLMVTLPAMKMFYDNINPKQTETLYCLVDSLRIVYDNVTYMDFFKSDSLFTVDEMYNPTHLNPRGAKKFTLMLNDSIKKIEEIRCK